MNNVQEISSRGSKKGERRAQIIEVARRLIAAKGLRSLKIRDVAGAAGCSIGTVYNEFEDLDELVLAVSRDTIRALQAALTTAAHDDPVEQLHMLAQRYLDFATEHPNLLRALFEHRMEGDRSFPDDLLEMTRSTFALMYTPLARLLPEYPNDQVAVLAQTMFSATHGIISLAMEERLVAVTPDSLQRQIAVFVSTYLAGLNASATKR
jgi:AcrR family transcriptional regulator